jgi:predicted nucleotidyltransferase
MTTIREREIRPIVDRVAGIIRHHLPEPSFRILLFGSWATHTAVPTSDIDVGILGDGPVASLTMAHIREEVERLPTLRKVDVVDLWIVEERFRRSVTKQAEALG